MTVFIHGSSVLARLDVGAAGVMLLHRGRTYKLVETVRRRLTIREVKGNQGLTLPDPRAYDSR